MTLMMTNYMMCMHTQDLIQRENPGPNQNKKGVKGEGAAVYTQCHVV